MQNEMTTPPIVVTLTDGPKPKIEMGDGGHIVPPTVKLRATPKPKTEMGDGGMVTPVVKLHGVRQG